jgi:hypothetical protein
MVFRSLPPASFRFGLKFVPFADGQSRYAQHPPTKAYCSCVSPRGTLSRTRDGLTERPRGNAIRTLFRRLLIQVAANAIVSFGLIDVAFALTGHRRNCSSARPSAGRCRRSRGARATLPAVEGIGVGRN